MSLSFDAYIVLGVILFLIISLYKEFLRPPLSFLIAAGVLLISGIISPQEVLHGFANEQLAVIVLLLVLSSTLGNTSIIERAFSLLFKKGDSPKLFMVKMLSGVGISSAFLNNTPLVAMMMPYVNSWTKENGEAVSKYLMPLSFASILGGCVTLIGTSTNLIANGLAVEYGESSLGIFDFVYVGVPMLFLGILFLFLFGKKLLPSKDGAVQIAQSSREYCVETVVKDDSPLINKTVEEAGLRNLEGLFLVEIIKKNRVVRPAPPDVKLRQGDRLLFVGDTRSVAELTSATMGLGLPEPSTMPEKDQRSVVELVVAPNSRLNGRRLKDTDFRSLYNGAVMAIHRDGERLSGKIGEVLVRPGDLFLVLAGRDLINRVRQGRDFFMLSKVKQVDVENKTGALLLFGGLLLSIALAVLNLVPLFTSLVCLVVMSILFGMQKATGLKNKIDHELIIIIAMGLALGKGMINSGLAATLAEQAGELHGIFGLRGLLIGLFLITNLLTAFMTSKAAVAITLPVALSLAHALGLPVPMMILLVAYGGAASFVTPIGYQTNLMVYGPGGYTFKDYFKIGLPLTLLYCLVAVEVLVYVYAH